MDVIICKTFALETVNPSQTNKERTKVNKADESEDANNNGGDDVCGFPRVRGSAPVEAQQEENQTRHEERHADKVDAL